MDEFGPRWIFRTPRHLSYGHEGAMVDVVYREDGFASGWSVSVGGQEVGWARELSDARALAAACAAEGPVPAAA